MNMEDKIDYIHEIMNLTRAYMIDLITKEEATEGMIKASRCSAEVINDFMDITEKIKTTAISKQEEKNIEYRRGNLIDLITASTFEEYEEAARIKKALERKDL